MLKTHVIVLALGLAVAFLAIASVPVRQYRHYEQHRVTEEQLTSVGLAPLLLGKSVSCGFEAGYTSFNCTAQSAVPLKWELRASTDEVNWDYTYDGTGEAASKVLDDWIPTSVTSDACTSWEQFIPTWIQCKLYSANDTELTGWVDFGTLGPISQPAPPPAGADTTDVFFWCDEGAPCYIYGAARNTDIVCRVQVQTKCGGDAWLSGAWSDWQYDTEDPDLPTGSKRFNGIACSTYEAACETVRVRAHIEWPEGSLFCYPDSTGEILDLGDCQ